ncbi:MAG TPA: gluconate 2-dehydrogenase subunit 3 family protein [Steroidobacteraceae bacterium]|jgi:gluconate 2-dehydrogenase gamma chain|nr:gluconate 2-dehydrogenase subunit 3 family protein [Steroidobacteraceae bacterium]
MPSTINIDRRTLIHHLVHGGLAVSLMPGFAESAWSAVGAGPNAPPPALSTAADGMIAVIADVILPRSDTPSATDVGVPAWIDVVVGGYFSDTQRSNFLSDLAAIDNLALTASGARLADLQGSARAAVIASLDAASGAKDPTPAQRGYAKLKELVIVGYFTSKPVQTDILKVVVVPGRYDPNVPMAPPSVK